MNIWSYEKGAKKTQKKKKQKTKRLKVLHMAMQLEINISSKWVIVIQQSSTNSCNFAASETVENYTQQIKEQNM